MDIEEKDIGAIRFFDAEGGMLTSSVNADVKCELPEGALTISRKNFCKVSVQVMEFDQQDVQEYLGKGSFLSPVVLIEPVRRKFHKGLVLSLPLPCSLAHVAEVKNVKVIFSVSAGNLEKHTWDDITYLIPCLQDTSQHSQILETQTVNMCLTVTGCCAIVYCKTSIADVAAMMTEMCQKIMSKAYMSESVDSDTVKFLQASRKGDLPTILEVVSASNINSQNREGQTGLHLAAREGHIDLVEKLLQMGADTSILTKRGNSALHLACFHGKENVVKLMLQNGCDVNIASKGGFPSLYAAILEMHRDTVEILLSANADLTWTSPDGLSLLLVGAFSTFDKDKTMAMMNLLLKKVDLKTFTLSDQMKNRTFNCHGEFLLQCVGSRQSTRDLIPIIRNKLSSAAREELQIELDSIETSSLDTKRFLLAIKNGEVQEVDAHLSTGGNAKLSTSCQVTGLHWCSFYGHVTIVIRLLAEGCPVDSQTKFGFTPLYLAAQEGHQEVVKVLLKAGANTKHVIQLGLSAQDIAVERGHNLIVTAIRDAKKPKTLFEGKVMLRKANSIDPEKNKVNEKDKPSDNRKSCLLS